MKKNIPSIKTTRKLEKKLEKISPFELKNNLIALAAQSAFKSNHSLLNAGRGNPNWMATTPREALYTLGKFALSECRLSMNYQQGLAGIPRQKGIAQRFQKFLKVNKAEHGISLLSELYQYGIKKHGFEPDVYVHEMAEAVIGDQYPVPDRMLKHAEAIVHDYLMKEMCNSQPPKGKYDLFAVEGGTAAMCYIFDSLMQNQLVKRGDKIALFVPTFTPYIEIPKLDRFHFKVIHINASLSIKDGMHSWEYTNKELDKLSDPSIKVAYLVNPSNPPSVSLSQRERKKIIDIVKKDNTKLMFITDDVYGTFVEDFRSLMAEIPHNTLCVYSFSKYFGCTGWRLGVIALHEKNIFDDMIAALPEAKKKLLHKRYESITLHPEKLKFCDRMVADSRMVALNHTAGLSLPQQMQMMLFAAFALFDKKNEYKQLTRDIVHRRLGLLMEGLGFKLSRHSNRAGYYAELDIMLWAKNNYGKDFTDYLKKNYEPVDILFRLAELCKVVLLNGGGFDGPQWSIRVSLANLDDNAYIEIAKAIKLIVEEYVNDWKKSNKIKKSY